MSMCERCGVFDKSHVENEGDSNLTQLDNYTPDRTFFWHGDIQEDYDMGEYDCLCETCFGEEVV